MDPFDLTDPLRFVRWGIALLPAEGPLNAEGFGLLEEIGRGLLKIAVSIGAAIASLDYRVSHGTRIADVAGAYVIE